MRGKFATAERAVKLGEIVQLDESQAHAFADLFEAVEEGEALSAAGAKPAQRS